MPPLIRDLAERALRTFAAAFAGVIAAGHITNLSTLRGVAIAAVAAGVSAVLSLAGSLIGTSGSASLDPQNKGASQ